MKEYVVLIKHPSCDDVYRVGIYQVPKSWGDAQVRRHAEGKIDPPFIVASVTERISKRVI